MKKRRAGRKTRCSFRFFYLAANSTPSWEPSPGGGKKGHFWDADAQYYYTNSTAVEQLVGYDRGLAGLEVNVTELHPPRPCTFPT